jgi:hypothetical protein
LDVPPVEEAEKEVEEALKDIEAEIKGDFYEIHEEFHNTETGETKEEIRRVYY